MSHVRDENKAFTLIELLIVVAIVGALAGIVVISIGGSSDDATDAVKKANIRLIGTLYAQVLAHEATEGLLDQKSNFCGGDMESGSSDSTKIDKIEQQMKTILQKVVSSTNAGSAGSNYSGGTISGWMSGNISGRLVPDAGCVANNGGVWAVWSKLEDNTFWCVDSLGSADVKASKKNLGRANINNSKINCNQLFN